MHTSVYPATVWLVVEQVGNVEGSCERLECLCQKWHCLLILSSRLSPNLGWSQEELIIQSPEVKEN